MRLLRGRGWLPLVPSALPAVLPLGHLLQNLAIGDRDDLVGPLGWSLCPLVVAGLAQTPTGRSWVAVGRAARAGRAPAQCPAP